MALGLLETSPARLQELQGARRAHGLRHQRRGLGELAPGQRRLRSAAGRRATSPAGRASAGWTSARRTSLRPILAKRLDLCRSKGFDGVLLRNVDGYAHRTGFPLTAKDQLAFNRWLAAEARSARAGGRAHEHAASWCRELVEDFDFAVSEGCFEAANLRGARCRSASGDKAAFVIEYTNVRRKMDAYCAAAADLDLQVVFKTKSLNGKIHRRCP